jgi:membrane-bound metal-dependent hydrolase YbcI (DUF457 family)
MVPRRRAGLTAALILGSLFPDIDAALVTRGFDSYLHAHASGAHSVLGTVVGAVIVGVTVRAFAAGAALLPLVVAAFIGTIGHVVCDLANGSDIRFLEPFSSRTFGWHLVVMGEPILLVALAAGVVTAWWRPSLRRRAATAALAFVVLFCLAKALTQSRARALFSQRGGGSPTAVAVAPKMAAPFTWTVVERRDDRFCAWTVDVSRGTVTPDFEFRDASGATVGRSRGLPVVQTFIALARMPFARTEGDGATQIVLWSDMTTCSARGCDVSFGGAFDSAGTPLFQVIRVGGFIEKRPLTPSLP